MRSFVPSNLRAKIVISTKSFLKLNDNLNNPHGDEKSLHDVGYKYRKTLYLLTFSIQTKRKSCTRHERNDL